MFIQDMNEPIDIVPDVFEKDGKLYRKIKKSVYCHECEDDGQETCDARCEFYKERQCKSINEAYPDRKDLYYHMFEKCGIFKQMVVYIEECSELQKAITKMLRNNLEDDSLLDDLAEEIADVKICIEQLEMFFNQLDDRILLYMYQKLKRLETFQPNTAPYMGCMGKL